MKISLLALEILVHYARSRVQYSPKAVAEESLVKTTLGELVEAGLMDKPALYKYQISEKGYAHVKALREVTLPIQQWVQPA